MRVKWYVGLTVIVPLSAMLAGAQEVSLYGAALDGNLRHVLQIGYGGGVSVTALYDNRIGGRVDAGFYEARGDYAYCPPCTACGSVGPCIFQPGGPVNSVTPFDVQDAFVVFAPYSAAGLRFAVGAGASHFSLSNTQKFASGGSVVWPKTAAHTYGPVVMASLTGRPPWRVRMAGEATLLYHRSNSLPDCAAGAAPPTPPFCGSFGATELRLSAVYTPGWLR